MNKNLAFDFLETHSIDVDGVQDAYRRRIRILRTQLQSREITENELRAHVETLIQARRCLISQGVPSPQPQIATSTTLAVEFERFTGFRPGAPFAGRFRLDRVLGAGGLGTVWSARDKLESKAVALKFLPPLRSADRETLRRELTSLIAWRHRCFAQTYALYEEGNECAICCELINAPNLQLARSRKPGSIFHVREIEPCIAELCEGLGAAYERFGFAHGAIKPTNLFLDVTGQLKIVDFGLTNFLRFAVADTDGVAFLDHSAYISPQVRSGASPEFRDDIYSIGVVLYELLTGELPFGPSSAPNDYDSPSVQARRTVLGIEEPISDAWDRAITNCLETGPGHKTIDIAALEAAFGLLHSTSLISVQFQHEGGTFHQQAAPASPTPAPARPTPAVPIPTASSRPKKSRWYWTKIAAMSWIGFSVLSHVLQQCHTSVRSESAQGGASPTSTALSPTPFIRPAPDLNGEVVPKNPGTIRVPTPSESTDKTEQSPVPTPSESTDKTEESPVPRASLVPSETTTKEIVNFLQRHLNLEQQHDIRSSMPDYAPHVLYYDKDVEQGIISKDKQDYFSRWPVTQEQTVGEMSVSSLVADEKWSVTFRSTFRVENPQRGDWIQGQVDCYYVLGRTYGGIKILTENSHVLQRQKGTLGGQIPTAPLGQGTSPQSEDQPQITRGQRRVYTLPELKNLFGHRLNAAWLRGDFIVVQRLGSHAVLRSRAETARFGLEILQNGRPMIFPGQTFINVTLNREISGMMSDNLITFPESDPLRLTSVSKDAQGHTLVEAEF